MALADRSLIHEKYLSTNRVYCTVVFYQEFEEMVYKLPALQHIFNNKTKNNLTMASLAPRITVFLMDYWGERYNGYFGTANGDCGWRF